MVSLRSIPVLCLLTLQVTAYNIWIDKSCRDKDPDFGRILLEARYMANRAVMKLDVPNPVDDDYLNIFQVIFNTPTTDSTTYSRSDLWQAFKADKPNTPLNLVRGTLGDIKNWKESNDQAGSDVRLYCDNGAHFESQNGIMVDLQNFVARDSNTRPCDNPEMLGTTALRLLQGPTTSPQKDERAVITLCDTLWNNSPISGMPRKFIDKPRTWLWSRLNNIQSLNMAPVEAFASRLVSKTLLHELLHTRPYLLGDTGGITHSYGWGNFIQLPTKDAVNNAESLAYFATWSVLSDKFPAGKGQGAPSFTLARRPDQGAPNHDDLLRRAEDSWKRGEVRLVNNPTGQPPPGVKIDEYINGGY